MSKYCGILPFKIYYSSRKRLTLSFGGCCIRISNISLIFSSAFGPNLKKTLKFGFFLKKSICFCFMEEVTRHLGTKLLWKMKRRGYVRCFQIQHGHHSLFYHAKSMPILKKIAYCRFLRSIFITFHQKFQAYIQTSLHSVLWKNYLEIRKAE